MKTNIETPKTIEMVDTYNAIFDDEDSVEGQQ